MATLKTTSSLSIRVLINDQLDNIAPSTHPSVLAPGRFSHIPFRPLSSPEQSLRAGAGLELHLPNSCCGAHGLSLLIILTDSQGQERRVLFDAGPEGQIWVTNVRRLQLEREVGRVEIGVLSHWHRDHSGGFVDALGLINANRGEGLDKVVLDLHPMRPSLRGIQTPRGVVTLEADPSFEELEAAGGRVEMHDEGHAILGGLGWVSGEIPRITGYETGFPNGVRLDCVREGWVEDEAIADERFLMVELEGKGLVVFTGCSHAGLVNVVRHAVEVGGGRRLCAVVGGFHLSDAEEGKVKSTVDDLLEMGPEVVMPGHCTGWRFLVELAGRDGGRGKEKVVPLYGGQKYGL